MTTTHEIRNASGEVLATFTGTIAERAADIRAALEAHPGSELRTVVTPDDPCPDHPAYERDYCPLCGTAREIGDGR